MHRAKRIYVQKGIAEDFVEALTERIADAAVGHGLGNQTVVGPLIDGRAVRQMQEFTSDAVARGATVPTGGFAYDAIGSFSAPTVLDGVSETAAVSSNEIFGPIAAIQRFGTEDEVVARANATSSAWPVTVPRRQCRRARRVPGHPVLQRRAPRHAVT